MPEHTILDSLPRVAVVIPAANEEEAIPRVLAAIPAWVNEVIVVDNASSDRTAERARACGARVVAEPRRGYGSACRAGLAALGEADVVVFLDADFADDPAAMARLVEPIAQGRADLVVGSRALGHCEPGAMTPIQIAGNRLVCRLIRWLWRAHVTDLGPFRAVRHDRLACLRMEDPGYGWTLQMQLRALAAGLRYLEVPVSYRSRIGRSKISGTVRGTLGAARGILLTLARETIRHRRHTTPSTLRAGTP